VRTRKLARYLSTPDTSLSPEEIERLKEILKQTIRPFHYELQMPAAKRPEEEEEEEEEEDEDDGKKEENEEEDEQQEPWRLT
jgi:ribosomal protein L12E/L44/L45/RPP1/RPP2